MAKNKVSPIREEKPGEMAKEIQDVVIPPNFVVVPVNLIVNLLEQEAGANRVALKTTCQEIRVLYQDQILKPDPAQVNYPDTPDAVKPLPGQ